MSGNGHPWFGEHRLAPRASADTIREMLRAGLHDTGWPYQDLLPAAPLTLPRASYAELFRAGSALLDLLRRTALETARTTPGRLGAYRMPEAERALFGPDQFLEERYAGWVARPDIVIGPDGPRFLEFNVSSALGGPVEAHARLAVWRRLYADDTGRLPFSSPDPLAVRAEMFREICAELAVEPRIAVVGSTRVSGAGPRLFELEAEYFAAQGLTARFFETDDLHQAWDCPPGLRFPVGLRGFTNGDFARYGVGTAPVQAALDHGCLLVTTQSSVFLHSKLTMGALSEGRPWMSAADRRLIDRYLPWTRVLTDRRTLREDRPVDLVRFARDHRELLVLKSALGDSGNEVLIGRETSQGEWESAVGVALAAGTSVIQDFVAPRTCRLAIIADGSAEADEVDIAPVFGPLFFGGRPAGLWTRFFGDGAAGVVSVRGDGRTSSDNCVVAV